MAKRQEQAKEHRKRVRMQRPRGEELVRSVRHPRVPARLEPREAHLCLRMCTRMSMRVNVRMRVCVCVCVCGCVGVCMGIRVCGHAHVRVPGLVV